MKHATYTLITAAAIAACAAQKPAQYAAELEGCLQTSRDCTHYVDCRKAVAEKYGRMYDGVCLIADAGTDAGEGGAR